MNAPLTAEEQVTVSNARADARAAARAKFVARQARQAARQGEDEARRAIRDENRELRRASRAARREDRADAASSAVRRAAPGVATAIPVAMVNATAFIGQFAYIREHVPWILPGQVLVAATFESVAVYVAWAAHVAMMKNDSSTRLKLGAQLFALIMGAMNYSHYSVHWHPTVLAVGMGLMSLLSPSLWGIYSRRAARDRLMERGLVEEHAVRLGANRWSWHPVRSVLVMWRATWVGENHPAAAIALYEEARQDRRARNDARRAAAEAARQDRRATAEAAKAAPAPARQPVAQPGAPALPAGAPAGPQAPSPGTQVNGKTVRAVVPLTAAAVLGSSHPIDAGRVRALELYLASLPDDQLPSQRDAAAMLCDQNHDHRRQAKPLIDARKAAGSSQLPGRPRAAASPVQIASPVGTLPGGVQP